MVKKVGKYELGKTLGKGTFSKVKYAIDTETGSAYAVKIVDRQQVVKENMEQQLKREIAIMKMLHHKYVVDLREVLQTVNHIYIVLELVTGGELFEKIVEAKRFEESVARRYFQQLITGMSYCHKQGIAHRDLKPENLLLDENDTLKISDFGLSALSEGKEGQNKLLMTTCGTPNYVAPEVLSEKGYDGMMADIWSCGVILFVMLAGYLPFDDPSMNGLFAKIEQGRFQFPHHFSADTRALISRMLVVNPHKRITLSEIENNTWFRVNYEQNCGEVLDTKIINPTDDHISQALSMTEVHRSSSTQAKFKVEPGAMNAFELASTLMMGSLNPLVSKAAVIRRETRFMAQGSLQHVMDRLIQVLTQKKANPKAKENEIKCYLSTSRSLLTFAIVVQPTISQFGLNIVEVRRGRGDTLEFNEFYRQLLHEVRDIVSSSENKNNNNATK